MSTLRVDNIENSSGSSSPITIPGTAKAWVNFNGTSTVAIRASYNVSSITDNGTGDYTVNFTTALADANYSSICTSKWDVGQPSTFAGGKTNTISTTACSLVVVGNSSDAQLDSPHINFAVFR